MGGASTAHDPIQMLDDRQTTANRPPVRPVRAPVEPFTPDQVEQSIVVRFARQVDTFADQTAVIDADQSWTYGQLAVAADGVANAIATARPRVRPKVGLLGPTGGHLVAATLGILKAGGAVVPLDPSFPARRIRSIGLDAELDLVVTSGSVDGLVRTALGPGIRIIDMDDASAAPAIATLDHIAPGDPAYLLYTSGSTGEPKGTLHSHRAVLHRVRVYSNALQLGPGDCLLLIAKPTFVAWVTVLFGALLNGATACVVDVAAIGFVGLREVIDARAVTVVHSTPTVYRELVATLQHDERLKTVRAVALGGEEAQSTDFEAFRRHFAEDAIFVNLMASTESSISLVFVADATSKIEPGTMPLGYPAEATDVLLLDPYGQSTESVGEIAIRSRYLPSGYWNRPQLTAKAFSRDHSDPESITYRTGDLGRRRADGAIEFAGRRDRQVKLHGIRVEIGEVERALAALPQVRHVAVEALVTRDGTELVAYLEPSGSGRPTQHDLQDALRDQLPDYMFPSAIVWLDKMPRTSSNKIDRRALPAPPDRVRMGPLSGPRDDLERRLIGIWRNVLSRRAVGVDDDFFDMGGNSLKAVRLCDQIWRETGHWLPPSAVLENPTVAGLANRIRGVRGSDYGGPIPVQAVGAQRPLFVVPGAGSRILYVRNLAVHLGLDQPIYALHEPPTGSVSHMGSSIDRRVEDMAASYLVAMRRVQAHGPYDLVGFSFGGLVAYEIAQQLVAAGEQVGLLALMDSRHPSDPQLRTSLRPRAVARRVANQIGIVRTLGADRGAAYLSRRLRIGWTNWVEDFRERFGSRLPERVARVVRDPAIEGERDWLAADARASDRYRPRPYPGRVTYLWAEHSPTRPDQRQWAELALGGFNDLPLPGGHFTLLVEPLVGITAEVLAELLKEVRTGHESVASPSRGNDTAQDTEEAE